MRNRLIMLVLAVAALAALAGSAGHARRVSAAVSPVVVSIQFDDGNLDQYIEAWPILQAHNMVATFYVNSGHIGTADHMTWTQLQDLQANHNEIAGHTIDHVDIKKLKRIEGYITAAQANGGGWVQLVFHHVCVKCDAYQITPTHLDELLTWLQAQEANGVTVETTHQVIGGPVNPAVNP